jgi:hypothetical protein
MGCFDLNITFDEALINIVNASYKGATIEISIVCDINYGTPLYAPDGSIYTMDGRAVYVRSAKLKEYE